MKLSIPHLSSPSSLLGLSFDGSTMTACVMQLSNGQIMTRQKCQTNLTLDLFNSDPELVGREIRTHLDEAGIKTKQCVICIPLRWALTMQTELPELPVAEENDYIHLQAERGLPYPPQDLAMAVLHYQFPGAKSGVCIGALPVNRLAMIEKVAASAKLHLRSITFGITSLFAQAISPAGIILLLGENSVELAIKAGSGAAMLRSLESPVEKDLDGARFDTEMISRQLRITLGNLPQSFRSQHNTVHLFGPPLLCRNLADELNKSIQPLGLSAQLGQSEDFIDSKDSSLSPVAALAAAQHLQGSVPQFEFLPARPSHIKQITDFFSGRSVMRLVAAGASFIVLIILLFLIQYLQLTHLESKWKTMEPKVTEVQALQQKVRDYRSWFDNKAHSIEIARQLTSAFPEDGAAWATSIEIKGMSKVTCSGMARTDQDWLRMLEKLRNTPWVKALQVLQVRGGSPMQFSLNYTNGEGDSDGI